MHHVIATVCLSATLEDKLSAAAAAGFRHVSEYDHAWRIVEAADHPALGTCLDSFPILARGTELDTIAEIPADKLSYCQLADATDLADDARRSLVALEAQLPQPRPPAVAGQHNIIEKRGRW